MLFSASMSAKNPARMAVALEVPVWCAMFTPGSRNVGPFFSSYCEKGGIKHVPSESCDLCLVIPNAPADKVTELSLAG